MKSKYYNLFHLMSQEHGLTLLDTEMQEIIQVSVDIEKEGQSGDTTSIKNGQVCYFITKDGVQFATQKKNRRKSSCGGDDLNVVVITWDNIEAHIQKMVEFATERGK